MSNKAVFLDRDGVLNKNVFYPDYQEWESPRTLVDFEFLPGVFDSLRKLQDLGYLLFIVTNQPSYAKGKTSLEDLQEILKFCEKELLQENIKISKIYCSFKHPKSIIAEYLTPCKYRKPEAASLFEAAKEFALDLEKSWLIGDRDTDIECGIKAKVQTIRIAPDYEQNLPHNPLATHNLLDLKQATDIIAAEN